MSKASSVVTSVT